LVEYAFNDLEYAIQIARDWNVRDSGAGYVTRFEVEEEFLQRYPVQRVGRQSAQGALGSGGRTWWVQPAHCWKDRSCGCVSTGTILNSSIDDDHCRLARGFIWIYRPVSPLSEDFCRTRRRTCGYCRQ